MFSPTPILSHALTAPLAGLILLAVAPREPVLPLWAMELLASIFLYAWLFCVGASVGSFLNVVVYRLPRKKNLAYPGSQCPRCGHAIRLYDNIPILSWLALGGRCRDCKSPIPPRYFLVELVVATLFLAVALVETKLTGHFPRAAGTPIHLLISPYETLPFWSAYALHVVLLTTLLGAALIDFDGFRTPRRLFLPVILLAVGLHLTWLSMNDVPAWTARFGPAWQRYLLASSFELALGLAVGAIFAGAWRATTRQVPRFAPVMLFAAIGVVAGAGSVLEIGAFSAAAFAAAMLALKSCRANAVIPLAGVTLVGVVPRLLDLDLRFGHPLRWPTEWHLFLTASCLAATAIGALAAGLLAPVQYFAQPPADLPPVDPAPSGPLPAEQAPAEPFASGSPPVADDEDHAADFSFDTEPPPHDSST